jgi:transcription-repair coupling factor (superfamily II helicase)
MRDLEIRGAGNLLGPQQSGHITAVGFDLYCQLLQQSVSSLKGEKVKRRVEVETRLDFIDHGEAKASIHYPAASLQSSDSPPRLARSAVAAVPLSYISDSRQRIEVYRKLAQLADAAAAEDLRGELRDRFGPLPPAVDLLLELATLKVLASEHGISVIETKEDKLMLTRNNDFVMRDGKFPRLTKKGAKARLGEIKRWLRAV